MSSRKKAGKRSKFPSTDQADKQTPEKKSFRRAKGSEVDSSDVSDEDGVVLEYQGMQLIFRPSASSCFESFKFFKQAKSKRAKKSTAKDPFASVAPVSGFL